MYFQSGKSWGNENAAITIPLIILGLKLLYEKKLTKGLGNYEIQAKKVKYGTKMEIKPKHVIFRRADKVTYWHTDIL